SLDKRFHGPLEATSQGEMLTVMNPQLGSGGYVALERVNGMLAGRHGTFVLQHSGTMTRGVGALTVTVVPDSGTGDLEGLTGTMDIHIADDGSHSYEFRYALPTKTWAQTEKKPLRPPWRGERGARGTTTRRTPRCAPGLTLHRRALSPVTSIGTATGCRAVWFPAFDIRQSVVARLWRAIR